MRLPRLQFSLRTLVILVVIVAALASFHGARYARYRARFVARQQAAERGLFLYTRAETAFLYGSQFLSNSEPSFLERYDVNCFGREGGAFPGCVLSIYDLATYMEFSEEQNFREVLAQHPEIELVDVSLDINLNGKKTSFQRVAWAIASNLETSRETSRRTVAAMNELAQVRHLRRFKTKFTLVGDSWVKALSDAWVSAIPEKCSLREIDASTNIKPGSALLLLEKAPELEEFRLNPEAMSGEVRRVLEQRYQINDHSIEYRMKAKN